MTAGPGSVCCYIARLSISPVLCSQISLLLSTETCFCLDRAPVLVALALIECGMKYEDAVQFIRQ